MKLINTNIMRYLLWADVVFNALVARMLMLLSTLAIADTGAIIIGAL